MNTTRVRAYCSDHTIREPHPRPALQVVSTPDCEHVECRERQDRTFLAVVGHLSTDRTMRDLAAYGSATLSDNDQ